jgi:glucan phosphoethanolaminetransferase (alkaline phosphatase superfamily)
MRNIVKLSFYLGILVTIYLTGGSLIESIMPDYEAITNTTLLFQYGGMIGYSLFIIFIMMLQTDTVETIRVCKPRLSQWIRYAYLTIGLIFILIVLVNFALHTALIMALLFMLVTAILDMIRDKITQEHDGQSLHPKKII